MALGVNVTLQTLDSPGFKMPEEGEIRIPRLRVKMYHQLPNKKEFAI